MSFKDCKLGDVFDIVRGGSPRPIDQFITDDPDGYNWIMIGDAADGSKYITGTKKRVLRTALSKSRMVKPGDFLLTNSMSFGRPYITQIAGCIHDGWLALTPKHADKTDRDYFYHLLGSPALKREFERRAAGAVVKNLNIDLVRDVDIRIPISKAEQRRIAAILDKADAIRNKRERGFALADDCVRSIFIEMFGDPLGNPMAWPVQTLGAHLEEIRYGTSEKCGDQSRLQDIPVLRIPNVVNGVVDWSDLKYTFLTGRERDRLLLIEGDILFVRTNGNPNYVGRCAVFEGGRPAAFASYLIRARLRRGAAVTPQFVSNCLSMPSYRSRMIQEAKTTAGNYNANTTGLRSLPIIEPPQERQAAFARAVAGLSKVKRRMDLDRSEASDLFSALSQRAFRGEL